MINNEINFGKKCDLSVNISHKYNIWIEYLLEESKKT